jgi:hypothetical protein
LGLKYGGGKKSSGEENNGKKYGLFHHQ